MPIVRLNGHDMYYEVSGEGPPLLCIGGWGSYCHGNTHHVARSIRENYTLLAFDHRGLGESGDDLSVTSSMKLYAEDAAALLDYLGWSNVHVVGLVGMGACIAQELALARPELVRSMVNMNTWAKIDALLRHQLEMLRDTHRIMGWEAFQKLVCLWSFDENFYLENHGRLLGPDGPWRELSGRYEAHERLIAACLSHDTEERLSSITAPSLIIHCPRDTVNGPRLTEPIEQAIPGAKGVVLEGAAHVVAGKELREEFSRVVGDFLKSVEQAQGGCREQD